MAFGCWWLPAVGGFWLLVAFGFWWLLAVGGFWLFVAFGFGGFWLLVAFGFWWLLAFGGFWLLVASTPPPVLLKSYLCSCFIYFSKSNLYVLSLSAKADLTCLSCCSDTIGFSWLRPPWG